MTLSVKTEKVIKHTQAIVPTTVPVWTIPTVIGVMKKKRNIIATTKTILRSIFKNTGYPAFLQGIPVSFSLTIVVFF